MTDVEIQYLTKEFQKFVGDVVKNPERMTCDLDTDEGLAMVHLARKKGLAFAFVKAGNDAPEISLCVVAEISQDNLPKDKPWGWRVQSIDIK